MSRTKLAVSALSVALVLAAVVGASAGSVGASAQGQDGERAQAYAGTHVTFDVAEGAVVDYAVANETMLSSVEVQSKNDVESGLSVGGDLSAVTSIAGAAVTVDARTRTNATITAESGAELHAHDNANGVLVVRAGDEGQYVTVDAAASATAEQADEDRVVVRTENGTEGAILVVGDGEVTVNDEGNVTADLGADARLVFRAYPDGRDDEDARQERLIADGEAAAAVHVMQDGEETVSDTVEYGNETAVNVTHSAEGRVTMTANRTVHEGTVLITSVSSEVLEASDELSVTVDGEAAVEASSYADLRSAVGNDSSKYLVRQRSDAEARADVLIAVNHFSTREVSMTSADEDETTSTETPDADSTPTDTVESTDSPTETQTVTDTPTGSEDSGTNTDGDASAGDGQADPTDATEETSSPGQPGFDFVVVVVTLGVAALLAWKRRIA